MKTPKHLTSWIAAVIVTLVLAGFFTWRLLGEDRSVYTPGAMTHGHYQIELACDSCHTPFNGVKQQACVDCHGARCLEVLNALQCITCHLEHRPQQTRAMGVTLPTDYCFHCHQEIGDDRPSHKNLAYNSCASAGCHNYHDNTALYEDFLVKHLIEPKISKKPEVPARNLGLWMRASGSAQKKPLRVANHDAPPEHADTKAISEWAKTTHAQKGVNCRECHQPESQTTWTKRPDYLVCHRCHEPEAKGFVSGKHGMRLAQKLPPMSPALARLPMRAKAHDQSVGCSSCHGAHEFNTRSAAAEACLGCHEDEHSKAFLESPHRRLWQAELDGKLPPGRGVSCATCHLPRVTHREGDVNGVRVQHNQNWNLRPNEKMIRSVCLPCHGLGFTLDALADAQLIKKNFNGQPSRHVESLDWAAKRVSQPSQGVKP